MKPGWMTQLATLGPIGNLPAAPGTWGSLATVIAASPLVMLGASDLLWILAIAVSVFGIALASEASKQLNDKDPKSVVIDEVAGQLIVLAVAPASILGLLLAFGLFRLFDISKIPPVRQAERLPKGLGIMADDVVAGIMGAVVLLLLGLLPGV